MKTETEIVTQLKNKWAKLLEDKGLEQTPANMLNIIRPDVEDIIHEWDEWGRMQKPHPFNTILDHCGTILQCIYNRIPIVQRMGKKRNWELDVLMDQKYTLITFRKMWFELDMKLKEKT